MDTFDSYFELPFLKESFESFRESHYDFIKQRFRVCTGSDRMDLDLFTRDIEMHLSTIRLKAIEKRYTFNAFIEQEIPKADSNKFRTISIASIRDTIVQKSLYQYLYPFVDARLTDSVFGYRKKRSSHQAVRY